MPSKYHALNEASRLAHLELTGGLLSSKDNSLTKIFNQIESVENVRLQVISGRDHFLQVVKNLSEVNLLQNHSSKEIENRIWFLWGKGKSEEFSHLYDIAICIYLIALYQKNYRDLGFLAGWFSSFQNGERFEDLSNWILKSLEILKDVT